MDANTKRINHIKVKNTISNLEKNNIKAVYVETKEEALTLFKTMVPEGSYTATGGSMTLRDVGGFWKCHLYRFHQQEQTYWRLLLV